MKKASQERTAIHPGPESCASSRKGAGEALTGAHVGQVLSPEIVYFPGCRRLFGYRPGQEVTEKWRIGRGLTAVVYVWVTVDKRDDVPAAIRHRISMKIGDYPEEMTIETLPTPVNRDPVMVITPPLRGNHWVAGNGPSNTSIHRRALIPIDGRAYISQRYAIDWVRLYPDGKTYQGDPSNNKNYQAYGSEVLAATDGIVTQTKDDIPQNTPTAKSLAVPIETIGGNHVIMNIGSGLYAFYAHLQTGSVRVKVGDKVRRGQVLGLLGNSGNSSEPHLHFHICDANSELGCEGFPYAFASFEVEDKGFNWKSSESREAPLKHEMEIPLEDEVVVFPAAPNYAHSPLRTRPPCRGRSGETQIADSS
jgi:Peptidase family M23